MLQNSQHDEPFDALVAIASDLTASLAAADRYDRLLRSVRRIVPCDAACLLRLEDDVLVPVAAHGLSPEAVAHRYDRREHPRLDIILRSRQPTRFPPDSSLPDPFDGFLEADPHGTHDIHACLGCSLIDEDRVVGALTADALEPHAFDNVDARVLAALGALAGAALRTTALIEALEQRAERTVAVAQALQHTAAQTSGGHVVGTSKAIQKLLEDIDVVAGSELPVLITGETGVGKELVAHMVHDGSPRRGAALIHVNCAALPESIAESELFGHVAGAFTGASSDRAGKFEIADGATLFLDEVGELPLTVQPKLLRALQQGEIQRVGSDRPHRVDVRVVTATNRDLEAEIAAGRFRADLYHRLAVYPVRVPPLRERREDIPLLAAHFLASYRRRLGLGPLRLSADAIELLRAADWPGNVRELENVVSRAVLRRAAGHRGDSVVLVNAADIDVRPATARAETERPAADPASGADARTLRERVESFQRRQILEALEASGGVWAEAARALGLHRSNLHHLAKRLGLRDTSGATEPCRGRRR